MKIITISLPIIWEDKEANFNLCNRILHNIMSGKFCQDNDIDPKSTLIMLPEMFSCGFTMNTNLAEVFNLNNKYPDKNSAPSFLWVKESSAKYGCAIMTSVPVKDNGCYYNRGIFMMPDGNFSVYDKKHLFRMGDEGKTYTPGNRKSIVMWQGVRFNMNICYDLRFPVWSRNSIGGNEEYDVLLNCANFPQSRANVLDPLVRARAIENMAYVAFVNRSGSEPTIEYCNSSIISDYKGSPCAKEVLASIDGCPSPVQILISQINIEKLSSFREKFPAWKDADKFFI